MNKVSKFLSSAVGILLVLAISAPAWAQAHPKNAQGEEFFIISSVDLQKQQIVLMRPTQLTIVANAGPQTIYLGEKAQKLTMKNLKAGDTVWALTKANSDGTFTLRKIREGAMTVAEMKKLYLHLPVSISSSTPATKPSPMTPRPQSGEQAAPPAQSASPYSSQSGNARLHRRGPRKV